MHSTKAYALLSLSLAWLLTASGEGGTAGDCTGRIGNFIWHDLDGDGIQEEGEPGLPNVRVIMTDLGGNLLEDTLSKGNGFYILGGDLCAGDYLISVDESTVPAGFVRTACDAGPDDTLDSDCQPFHVPLPDDHHRGLRIDFGYRLGACEGSLGDFVWNDLNGNGVQEGGEPGIADVVVWLMGPMGLMESTTTDANGRYEFQGLCAGTYRLEVDGGTMPHGFAPSPCDVGPDDTIDNDCSPKIVVLPADDTQDPTCDFGFNRLDLGCRLTAGGNCKNITTPRQDVWSVGGQIGAPTHTQPQPCGEWTHTQRRGPSGKFTFHGGTASAPEGTEIAMVVCSDPGNCEPASNPAHAKQINFCGTGTFHNVTSGPFKTDPRVVVGVSLHWFDAHCEDLGEPGNGGSQPAPGSLCPLGGFEEQVGECDCPDFYRIRIHADASPSSPVIYETSGYLSGGNFQMHDPIGGHTCQ
jgi:hypothetical protein